MWTIGEIGREASSWRIVVDNDSKRRVVITYDIKYENEKLY